MKRMEVNLMKNYNHLFMRLFLVIAMLSLTALGYSTVIANFESDSVSKWGIYEAQSGAWYANTSTCMTVYPKAYMLSDNGGSTTYARLLFDYASSGYVFWSINIPPTEPCTTIVIRYRGYAQGGNPSYTAQFRFYGEDSTGLTGNGNNITGGLTVTDTVTWTVVTCSLGVDSGGMLSDVWVELHNGSGPEVQGLDIQYVQVNGVNILQKDTTGSVGSWVERDWAGWAHGLIGTAYVGAPYGNVGVSQIWDGDNGSIVRHAINLPHSQWINLTTERYLHFDMAPTFGTSSGWVKYNIMLYSQAAGATNAYQVQGDTVIPTNWKHVVVDCSQNATLYNYSTTGLPDIWRVEFLTEDKLFSNVGLIGFYLDNITFSSSSIVPYITPSSIVGIKPGGQQVFTVNGGEAPFSWSLSTTGIGVLNTTSGNTVTFTSSSTYGSVTLTLTDANNMSSSVTINIVPTSAPLYKDIENPVLYDEDKSKVLFE